jgi:hypothetical protein
MSGQGRGRTADLPLFRRGNCVFRCSWKSKTPVFAGFLTLTDVPVRTRTETITETKTNKINFSGSAAVPGESGRHSGVGRGLLRPQLRPKSPMIDNQRERYSPLRPTADSGHGSCQGNGSADVLRSTECRRTSVAPGCLDSKFRDRHLDVAALRARRPFVDSLWQGSETYRCPGRFRQ